jgi:hypothetical protein
MKIEYLTNTNPAHPKDSILRIFDFTSSEACQFRDILSKLADGLCTEIVLNSFPFVTSVADCRLVLKVGQKDKGVISLSANNFECILTRDAWEDAQAFVEPFCDTRDVSGYQWLYNLNTHIELLFSKNGDW